MFDLRNRPLLATRADQQRFVDREADVESIMRALQLRFNVMVLGERGFGTSSLLGRLDALAADRADLPPVKWVRGGRASGAAELLDVFSDALGAELPTGEAARSVDEPALQLLRQAADEHGPAVLIVDGLASGRLAHAVFGRLRDELWQIDGLQWVVGLAADQEPSALTPPADQFFELVHRLGPMAEPAIEELLRRRGASDEIDETTLRAIADASHGNPSTALRLARAAHVDPGRVGAPADVVAAVFERLGAPAGRLATELSAAGPSGPSDQELLNRLGWSRPRAYQVFGELEHHGFVEAAQEHNGRPGRPRKLYKLKETIR